MDARLAPARELLKLTRENHPENAVAPKPQAPTVGLASMVGISALCGLVGMIFGTACLSTAMLADTMWEVVCLLPLAVAAVCFLSGWVGAFFWMCREESAEKESRNA
jgi:hypothetical protein